MYGDVCLNGINQVSDHYAEGYWNNTCLLSSAGSPYLDLNEISFQCTQNISAGLHTCVGGAGLCHEVKIKNA